MKFEYKRGDKCPCGRSHFRAYEKTKHGALRPKFQSREVFLANQAADLRRQRLERARAISEKHGLTWIDQYKESAEYPGWPRVLDGGYMLSFADGFMLRVEVTTRTCAEGTYREVCAVVNKRKYSFSEVSVGMGTPALKSHSIGFQLFANTQR